MRLRACGGIQSNLAMPIAESTVWHMMNCRVDENRKDRGMRIITVSGRSDLAAGSKE